MASVRKRNWKASCGETKAAWVVDYTDTHGNRQRKHFSTKKAADAFRISIEGQIQAGTYRAAADKVTVKEACESFLEYCEGRNERDERMTRKMLVVYRGHINNHILHAEHGVGSRKLSQFTAGSVGKFRDELRGVGTSIPTTRKILATLHSVLEHAISQDWVAVNVAQGTKVIGKRDEGSKKVVPPPKEDIRKVLEAADDDMHLVLHFAASTGARAGEQWAARWRDLDFGNAKLHIRRRVDVYGEEGPPKSKAGIRDVPLSAQLMSDLKAWRLRSKFSKQDDLIFANREGGHIGHDNFIKRQFLTLFDKLEAAHKDDPKNNPMPPKRCRTDFDTSPCRAGSRQDLRRRRYRLSLAMRRCKSRWIAMAISSQATITGRRWIRSPRDCSHDEGERSSNFHVPSM